MMTFVPLTSDVATSDMEREVHYLPVDRQRRRGQRRRKRPSSHPLDAGILIVLLLLAAFLSTFVIIPHFLSVASEIFPPKTFKDGVVSINLIFIFFAGVFWLLSTEKRSEKGEVQSLSSGRGGEYPLSSSPWSWRFEDSVVSAADSDHQNHQNLQSPPPFSNIATVVAVLLFAASLFTFFIIPPVLSRATKIFPPDGFKKSFESLNLVLLLFVTVCIFLIRNNDNGDGDGAIRTPVSLRRQRQRRSRTPEQFLVPTSGLTRRKSSSVPDLRQLDDWRQRFSDYEFIHSPLSPPISELSAPYASAEQTVEESTDVAESRTSEPQPSERGRTRKRSLESTDEIAGKLRRTAEWLAESTVENILENLDPPPLSPVNVFTMEEEELTETHSVPPREHGHHTAERKQHTAEHDHHETEAVEKFKLMLRALAIQTAAKKPPPPIVYAAKKSSPSAPIGIAKTTAYDAGKSLSIASMSSTLSPPSTLSTSPSSTATVLPPPPPPFRIRPFKFTAVDRDHVRLLSDHGSISGSSDREQEEDVNARADRLIWEVRQGFGKKDGRGRRMSLSGLGPGPSRAGPKNVPRPRRNTQGPTLSRDPEGIARFSDHPPQESERPIVVDVNQREEEVPLRWSAPPLGCYKLNTHGSARGSPAVAAAGGVIRDHNGNWISGFRCNLGRGMIENAELWVIFEGLSFAWGKKIRFIKVETDSSSTIDLIRKCNEPGHPAMRLVLQCKDLMNRDWDCSLHLVLREANAVADWLATEARSHSLGVTKIDDTPEGVLARFNRDLPGDTTTTTTSTNYFHPFLAKQKKRADFS